MGGGKGRERGRQGAGLWLLHDDVVPLVDSLISLCWIRQAGLSQQLMQVSDRLMASSASSSSILFPLGEKLDVELLPPSTA